MLGCAGASFFFARAETTLFSLGDGRCVNSRNYRGAACIGTVHRWEAFATRMGMNRTKEGLHFQTQSELEAMLQRAGFARWEIKPGAGNDSNVMLVANGF